MELLRLWGQNKPDQLTGIVVNFFFFSEYLTFFRYSYINTQNQLRLISLSLKSKLQPVDLIILASEDSSFETSDCKISQFYHEEEHHCSPRLSNSRLWRCLW